MENKVAKPLPTITDFNRPFWTAAKKHELRLQRCTACEKLWAPNGPACPFCLSEAFVWEKLSGGGRIASWVVFHKVYFPSFADDVPYNVALVELEEGPRLMANIDGVANEELHIGMAVQVVFHDVNDDVALPKFTRRSK